ncbi:MAG: endolytic transglycosylase MltG [Thermomicrobiales bacterium]
MVAGDRRLRPPGLERLQHLQRPRPAARPICNPGLASLQAAFSPTETTFLYFVARGDGTHVFAETPEEHQEVDRYVRDEQ